ncbi:MAG TPA: hypothetical protein VD769_08165 [Gaiellaceae bacterium]|nr:hypothetical protein [Gaiellaceae bacterium]
MTYLTLTQFETRHRQIEAELEREHARAAGRRVVPKPCRRRRAFGIRALRSAPAPC